MFNEEKIKKLDRKYASKEHHQDVKNDGAALMPAKEDKEITIDEAKYGATILVDFLDDFLPRLKKLRFKPGSRNERRMRNILWEMILTYIGAKALLDTSVFLDDMKENDPKVK